MSHGPIIAPEILRFLAVQGKSPTNDPIYRVVWSDDQFEWRKGVFNDFYGNIFLRSYTGVRYTAKYNYIRERFILERWFPPTLLKDERLPDANHGGYEPLFVFQDKNGNALPVILKVVEIIVYFDRQERERQTALIDKQLQELSETKEFRELYDAIDTTPIQSLLHSREAIIRP